MSQYYQQQQLQYKVPPLASTTAGSTTASISVDTDAEARHKAPS
jgi:hypothetical protein